MKRGLFFVVFVGSVFCCGNDARGQGITYYPDVLIDSTTFTFNFQDSLHHILYSYSCDTTRYNIDTSQNDSTNTNLWVIGNTSKTFFADSGYARGIMTDTVNYYPVNANSWFVLKYFVPFCHNNDFIVISFWHKYQTSLGHDGGLVEYSGDSGISWNNVINICTIETSNFYNLSDTLSSGERVFSGSSNGWVESQFKLDFASSCLTNAAYQIRFRFKSDSIPDTLAGWIIEKINIGQYSWVEAGLPKINKPTSLNIYPNPSCDAQFNFPALDEEQKYSMEVMDVMGRSVLIVPYVHVLNLSGYAKGIYFYRVSNGVDFYSGNLVVE